MVGQQLVEDPVELVLQKLWPGVGKPEGTGVGGAELAGPVVDVLEDVALDRPKVVEVEAAFNGIEFQLDNSEVGEIALKFGELA